MKIDSPRFQKLFVLLTWSRPSKSSPSVMRSITMSSTLWIRRNAAEEGKRQREHTVLQIPRFAIHIPTDNSKLDLLKQLPFRARSFAQSLPCLLECFSRFQHELERHSMGLCRLFIKMEAEYCSVLFCGVELVLRDLLGVQRHVFIDANENKVLGQFFVYLASVGFIYTNKLGRGRVERKLPRKNCYRVGNRAILGNK